MADTYLVLSLGKDGLALLDQHAAHERVLFESYKRAGRSGRGRALAIPLEISLHPSQSAKLQEMYDDLKALGFAIRTSGAGSASITATPASLEPGQARTLLLEALSGQASDIRDMWVMMACRSALKAGEPLAGPEAAQLISAWLECQDREFCPHGRPTVVRFDPSALARLFKRD